jgi:5-methyltetrahydrofolate--homocysteine methyltransferase
VIVAGVLGSEMIAPMAADRLQEELTEHAFRVATAGVDVLLSRGQGSKNELMAAVVAAGATELPVWAIVECAAGGEPSVGGPLSDLLHALADAGARAIVFEVNDVDDGINVLGRACPEMDRLGLSPGVLLAVGSDSVRGFPSVEEDPEVWAARALELDTQGARLIGGGAGTTEAHTRALVSELRALHPSIRPPR